MLNAVSNQAQTQPVAQTSGISSTKSTSSKSQPAAGGSGSDAVQLSSIAQAILAASREAHETSSQTALEASSGDRQAQRLLAKEATVRG